MPAMMPSAAMMPLPATANATATGAVGAALYHLRRKALRQPIRLETQFDIAPGMRSLKAWTRP